MPKQGILHDYDLMANQEKSARDQSCVVCGDEPMSFQWSDYSGEGMCRKCGTPYQLKWGTDEQVAGDAYPYLNMNEAFVPIAKEFFAEAKIFVYYGSGFGAKPGMAELVEWLKVHHPEELNHPEEEVTEG